MTPETIPVDKALWEQAISAMTPVQRMVLLAFSPGAETSWVSAPHAGCYRRQGGVARQLQKRHGLLEARHERSNGLWWFKLTSLGRAVLAALREKEAG